MTDKSVRVAMMYKNPGMKRDQKWCRGSPGLVRSSPCEKNTAGKPFKKASKIRQYPKLKKDRNPIIIIFRRPADIWSNTTGSRRSPGR